MLLVAIVAVVVILLASSGSSSPKVAVLPQSISRKGPETIFTPGAALKTETATTLDTLEKLGVTRVRLFFTWNQLAPDPTATVEPAGFDAANPAAYPASGWTQYDTIIKAVEAHHLGLDAVLGPPPPRWAAGKGADQTRHADLVEAQRARLPGVRAGGRPALQRPLHAGRCV